MCSIACKFGEDMCTASGNKLFSLLREVELVACKGRQCQNQSGLGLGLV